MKRKPKPTCGICGWEFDAFGQCLRLDLHWTVCPECKRPRDFARRCRNGCATGRGVAAVERLIWEHKFILVA